MGLWGHLSRAHHRHARKGNARLAPARGDSTPKRGSPRVARRGTIWRAASEGGEALRRISLGEGVRGLGAGNRFKGGGGGYPPPPGPDSPKGIPIPQRQPQPHFQPPVTAPQPLHIPRDRPATAPECPRSHPSPSSKAPSGGSPGLAPSSTAPARGPPTPVRVRPRVERGGVGRVHGQRRPQRDVRPQERGVVVDLERRAGAALRLAGGVGRGRLQGPHAEVPRHRRPVPHLQHVEGVRGRPPEVRVEGAAGGRQGDGAVDGDDGGVEEGVVRQEEHEDAQQHQQRQDRGEEAREHAALREAAEAPLPARLGRLQVRHPRLRLLQLLRHLRGGGRQRRRQTTAKGPTPFRSQSTGIVMKVRRLFVWWGRCEG